MPSDILLQWAASACPEYDPASAPAPHRLPAAGSDRRLYRLFGCIERPDDSICEHRGRPARYRATREQR